AVAAAIAGWVNTALLRFTLVRRGHWGSDRALLLKIPKLAAASAVMAAALFLPSRHLEAERAAASPLAVQVAALAALVVLGMIVYLAMAFALGGADLRMIKRSLRRSDGPTGPA